MGRISKEGWKNEEIKRKNRFNFSENTQMLSVEIYFPAVTAPPPVFQSQRAAVNPESCIQGCQCELGSRPPGGQTESSLTRPGVFSWVLSIV